MAKKAKKATPPPQVIEAEGAKTTPFESEFMSKHWVTKIEDALARTGSIKVMCWDFWQREVIRRFTAVPDDYRGVVTIHRKS